MRLLIVLASCMLAFSASAQQKQSSPNGYVEASFAPLSIDAGDGIKPTPDIAKITFGHVINTNLEAELNVLATLKKDSVNVQSNGDNVNLDVSASGYGLYLKPKIELDSGITLFARGGWSHAELKVALGGVSVSQSGNSFSYGIGAKGPITNNVYWTADWMSYYKKDGVKATGPSIGIGLLF